MVRPTPDTVTVIDPSFATRRIVLAACAALLLASACTTMRSKIEPPQITLESVRIVRIAEGKADLSASLRLANRNDFELETDAIELAPATIRRLADRHLGVGCDQVLVVERPTRVDVDFRYRIFNADGGEVEQCGNGARCFVLFVRSHGLTDKRAIRVETAGGVIEP